MMPTVASSYVNKCEMPSWHVQIIIRITKVMIILNTMVKRAYFLAWLIFYRPRKTPVKALAAIEMPRGTMKIRPSRLAIMTYAARASTLIRPAEIASSSKHHHSKQSIQTPGIPIFRYSPILWNACASGFP